jgi:thiol-disulfide isomerase/thioredoxin
MAGKEIELSQFKGKGVLVNFWASWCHPCTREMPAIQNIYDEYKNEGIEVLAINMDETEKAINIFLDSNPSLNFPILMNGGPVSDEYGVFGLPTSVFINPDGTIQKNHAGELNEEQLHVFINEILP